MIIFEDSSSIKPMTIERLREDFSNNAMAKKGLPKNAHILIGRREQNPSKPLLLITKYPIWIKYLMQLAHSGGITTRQTGKSNIADRLLITAMISFRDSRISKRDPAIQALTALSNPNKTPEQKQEAADYINSLSF